MNFMKSALNVSMMLGLLSHSAWAVSLGKAVFLDQAIIDSQQPVAVKSLGKILAVQNTSTGFKLKISAPFAQTVNVFLVKYAHTSYENLVKALQLKMAQGSNIDLSQCVYFHFDKKVTESNICLKTVALRLGASCDVEVNTCNEDKMITNFCRIHHAEDLFGENTKIANPQVAILSNTQKLPAGLCEYSGDGDF